MSRALGPDRRSFLKGLLAAIAAVVGGRVLVPTSAVSELGFEESFGIRDLTSLIVPQEDARIIGTEYLRRYPAEGARARLEVLVRRALGFGSLGRNGKFLGINGRSRVRMTGDGLARVRRRVQAAVRRDFEEGRTVNVRGWVLSQTEARVCALTALS